MFMCGQTEICVQYGLVAFYVINVLKFYNWKYGELYFQIPMFLPSKGT